MQTFFVCIILFSYNDRVYFPYSIIPFASVFKVREFIKIYKSFR